MENIIREPYKFVDEYSDTEYYVGWSLGSYTGGRSWNIKKIWKNGTQWVTGYPNGDQNNTYIWDNRYDYQYI